MSKYLSSFLVKTIRHFLVYKKLKLVLCVLQDGSLTGVDEHLPEPPYICPRGMLFCRGQACVQHTGRPKSVQQVRVKSYLLKKTGQPSTRPDHNRI